ncbi:MAG: monovalent cation:proton antiporter-2 (CPA2) family protein [Rhodovibrionaceae bacterium]|nr:monovalent cation:proton antiporter-2 (CPA2) family protein [Rhodovibrionaceae bacterium]
MPEPGHLNDVLVVLVAAIVFVSIFQRLRISPVLAYLAAGLVIGPHGLGLISDEEGAHFFAEFGVIFLLFSIGLELPFERIRALGSYIFGLGLAQVFLTSLLIALGAYALGATPEAALVIGGALALSSTATVLQLLVEKGEATTRHGRAGISVLLFQDLAVVPLLVLIPLLSGDDGHIVEALAIAGLKALAVLAGILLLGRLVVRPVYRIVAATQNAELFFATSLLLVLGTGYATAQANMSMALGAFLAGLLLAESEYRHQIEADIQPFRGLFLGLFFITVGMSIDVAVMVDELVLVLAIALGLIVGKAALIAGLCLAFRLEKSVALRVGLLLAQGGEFAFVILSLAVFEGVVTSAWAQPAVIAVAVTMAVTPLLAELGRWCSDLLEEKAAGDENDLASEAESLRRHVLIAGFGRVGETVARLLERRGVPYIALDLSVQRVNEARRRGLPVFFGDASRLEVLRAAGIERARAVVLTLDRPGPSEQAVSLVRRHYPKLEIIARGRDIPHHNRLRTAGADAVVPETVEASLQLAGSVLRSVGTEQEELERLLEETRQAEFDHHEEDGESSPSPNRRRLFRGLQRRWPFRRPHKRD